MSIPNNHGAPRLRPQVRLTLLSMGGALLLFLSACSGLGSEPEVVATIPPEPTTIAAAPAATEDPVPAAATEDAAPGATEDAASAVAATEEATAEASVVSGSVQVSVANGTPGGSATAGLALKLFVVDMEGAQTTFEGETDADGTYTFAEVPIRNDRFYVVTTVFNERAFGSDMTRGTPDTPEMELPVTVYEATDDPAALRIDSLQFRILGQPGSLQVAQVMRVTNTSDKMFSGAEKTADDRYPSVVLHMPDGAELMGTSEDEAQFIMGEDGSVTDTRAVLPGEQRTMHVIYTLPYQPLGTQLDVLLNYPLSGSVDVTISPISVDAGVTVAGQNVPALAAQSGETSDVRVLGGDMSAPAGAAVRLELRGEIASPDSASESAASGNASANTGTAAPSPGVSRDLLVGILIGAGLGLVALGVFFLVKDRLALRNAASDPAEASRESSPPADKDALIAELAALDERFARSEIGKGEYEMQRDQLKKQLARRMRG